MSTLDNDTADDLARLLAEITGRPLTAIRSMAANLREAGMLPEDGESFTSDHAANFVVAAVAASAASEAVAAVQVIGGMPLARQDHVSELPDGRAMVASTAAADIRVPPGCGSEWAKLTRSLAGALGYFIECARTQADEGLPNFLKVRRSLAAPAALIEIELPGNDPGRSVLWLSYGFDGDEHSSAYMVASLRMAVWALAPGLLVRLVGDLLAGRPSHVADSLSPSVGASVASHVVDARAGS
jgi:hypothetical protein